MRSATINIKQYVRVSKDENPVEFKRQYECIYYHYKKGDLDEFIKTFTGKKIKTRPYNKRIGIEKKAVDGRIVRHKGLKPTPLAVIRWKRFCGLI